MVDFMINSVTFVLHSVIIIKQIYKVQYHLGATNALCRQK